MGDNFVNFNTAFHGSIAPVSYGVDSVNGKAVSATALNIAIFRFGPTGLGKSAWCNALGFKGTNAFCRARAAL